MVDRRPNLKIAINSCAPSTSEPQPESAPTDERDTTHGSANADSGVVANETARRRRLHDDAESVVGTG